eukprot:7762124-Alexandrium_andersonii.AAC.2
MLCVGGSGRLPQAARLRCCASWPRRPGPFKGAARHASDVSLVGCASVDADRRTAAGGRPPS